MAEVSPKVQNTAPSDLELMSIRNRVLKQYLTALGFVVRLVGLLDHGPDGGGSVACDVIQPIFLTRVEAVGRSRSSGCSSHVCTPPGRAWFRIDASEWRKMNPSTSKQPNHVCNLVRTRVPAHKKNTVKDGSHGDDPTGVSLSSVRRST